MAEIISVSALNRYVHSLLEENPFLSDIAVSGEISNFNRNYKSGHCYFSIKDATASVKAVMFRSSADRLAFEPENGMKVLVRCRVSIYERDGAYQLYVEDIFPDGIGAAQLAFEQLKTRLAEEGLFAPEKKKALPKFPVCVGLVTSKTGAALQDILKVAKRRNPCARFLLAPVSVQGREAEPLIVAAIQQLDAAPDVDVIIIARGGGSAEDLWVFNSELIARAVYKCSKPVVSAIGHEIDFTILDFAADLRAPTPSAAVEIVLPDMQLVWQNVLHVFTNITINMQGHMDLCYNKLRVLGQNQAFEKTIATPALQLNRLQNIAQAIQQNNRHVLQTSAQRLQGAASLAEGLNPYGVLARGYSIAHKAGTAIKSVYDVHTGDTIGLTLPDGELSCAIKNILPKQEID